MPICWYLDNYNETPVATFTKEINLWLVFKGCLANPWLIPLVKEATGLVFQVKSLTQST